MLVSFELLIVLERLDSIKSIIPVGYSICGWSWCWL